MGLIFVMNTMSLKSIVFKYLYDNPKVLRCTNTPLPTDLLYDMQQAFKHYGHDSCPPGQFRCAYCNSKFECPVETCKNVNLQMKTFGSADVDFSCGSVVLMMDNENDKLRVYHHFRGGVCYTETCGEAETNYCYMGARCSTVNKTAGRLHGMQVKLHKNDTPAKIQKYSHGEKVEESVFTDSGNIKHTSKFIDGKIAATYFYKSGKIKSVRKYRGTMYRREQMYLQKDGSVTVCKFTDRDMTCEVYDKDKKLQSVNRISGDKTVSHEFKAGLLRSISRFKSGMRHGRQEYFRKDGSLKSVHIYSKSVKLGE